MKIGYKHIFVFGIGIAYIVYRKNNFNSIKQKNNEPNIGQYLNRFTEFFDVKYLDIAEDNFLNLIDFGMSPKAAFLAIIDTGE